MYLVTYVKCPFCDSWTLMIRTLTLGYNYQCIRCGRWVKMEENVDEEEEQ